MEFNDQQSGSTIQAQGMLNALTAHVALIDRDGIIVAVNEAWRRFAKENGDNGETYHGHNYFSVCEEAFRRGDGLARQAQLGIMSVLRGDTSHFELEYPCHSPKIKRWFTMRASRIPDADHLALILHENVTERVASALSAYHNEQRFVKLFSQSPTPMAITDTESSRLLDVNDAFLALFGGQREDFVGRTAVEITLISNEQEAHIRTVFETLGRVQGHQVEFHAPDGGTRVLSLWIESIAVDERSWAITRIYDITESVRARDELVELNKELVSKHGALVEKQSALRELLGLMDEERSMTRQIVAINIDKVIAPMLHLIHGRMSKSSEDLLHALDSAIRDITSPFVAKLTNKYPQLTQHEIQICSMIRSGHASHEIAQAMGVSVAAVHKSRLRLRRKLGITNSAIATGDLLNGI